MIIPLEDSISFEQQKSQRVQRCQRDVFINDGWSIGRCSQTEAWPGSVFCSDHLIDHRNAERMKAIKVKPCRAQLLDGGQCKYYEAWPDSMFCATHLNVPRFAKRLRERDNRRTKLDERSRAILERLIELPDEEFPDVGDPEIRWPVVSYDFTQSIHERRKIRRGFAYHWKYIRNAEIWSRRGFPVQRTTLRGVYDYIQYAVERQRQAGYFILMFRLGIVY